MYKAYEFTYAGIASSMYGLFVCNIGNKKHSDNAFGNTANIVETRLANRVTPIHFGVRYNDTPLSFSLIFGSAHEMDRFELQEIAQWLTGYQEYQWLTIDQPDMEHIQFRCLIQSLTPISVGSMPLAFEAKIVCDCPYGYSYPFEQEFKLDGTTQVQFYNESTSRELLRPMMKIALAAGCTEFAVTNQNTGETMRFSNLPGGSLTISIDNENCIITEDVAGYNLYDYFNFVFLALEPGDNQLLFEGTGNVVISGRYLYNVGA